MTLLAFFVLGGVDSQLPIFGKQCYCLGKTMKFETHLCLPKNYPYNKFGCQSLIHNITMTSSLLFPTTLSIIFHVCQSSIVSNLKRCQCFYLIFEMLECCSLYFNQKIANCIIQLSNSRLTKARKIIRILFFSTADVSNKFAKFKYFDKKDDQQHVFFSPN